MAPTIRSRRRQSPRTIEPSAAQVHRVRTVQAASSTKSTWLTSPGSRRSRSRRRVLPPHLRRYLPSQWRRSGTACSWWRWRRGLPSTTTDSSFVTPSMERTTSPRLHRPIREIGHPPRRNGAMTPDNALAGAVKAHATVPGDSSGIADGDFGVISIQTVPRARIDLITPGVARVSSHHVLAPRKQGLRGLHDCGMSHTRAVPGPNEHRNEKAEEDRHVKSANCPHAHDDPSGK